MRQTCQSITCKAWSSRKSATKKQLQSIAGSYISARRLVNRVLVAVRASPPVGSHPFEVEVLQDLGWFVRFASKFNGIVVLSVVLLND